MPAPVYTRLSPKPTNAPAVHQRQLSHASAEPRPLQPDPQQPKPDTAADSPPTPQPSDDSASTSAMAPNDAAEAHTTPLHIANPPPAQSGTAPRSSLSPQTQRSIGMALSGDMSRDEDTLGSPVMHETLSVIDEHITDMSTPRHSVVSKDMRGNDSGSDYSSQHRLSYINGHETEEEEQNLHTEEEVLKWSPARVAEYLEDAGVDKKHCNIFKEQEINGELLLEMDQATIFLKEFELGPVGPRLRTWLKIKALQQEVKTLKEAAKSQPAPFDTPSEPDLDPVRNRATSMGAYLPRIPSLNEGNRNTAKHGIPRANTTAGHSPTPFIEATSPLIQNTPASPPPPGTPVRPSAASVRSMNHNRRHSSIDQTTNPPTPGKAPAPPTPHKKTPSFDRNWTMGAPMRPPPSQDSLRPSSSQHAHAHSGSIDTTHRDGGIGYPSIANADLDRGYFSGGELETRKNRNVLRKKESPSHSRNPSYGTESGRRATYNRRHSRIGSSDSAGDVGNPVSPAAKAYYGSSIKSKRSSSTFEFVRPLKPMGGDSSPTVTKLGYNHSPSIDAIANSPGIAPSDASSQGRASPSAPTHSHSFFSMKSRGAGLRAISDAITGGERAHVGGSTSSPVKDSPMQSPARTGSSTPSGTSMTKSLDLENSDLNKRLTGSSNTSNRRKKKHSTSAYLRGREVITPQEAMAGCDYSGWMKKKSSSLMTTWKTRLFVLRGRRLSYFYSEMDTEEKGLIDISSHRVLPANNERMTGFHATITRASSTPTSPQNATIPTAAEADSAKATDDDEVKGMFIFKLVPPRAGLQKGVQFTKPLVHYFAVDNVQLGRLWMAALMKATIDRDDSLSITTTYQQKTISLDKARAMRQRPPALMDDYDDEEGSMGKRSKESVMEDVIVEEEDEGGKVGAGEGEGLAISGLDDAKALLEFAEGGGLGREREKERETPSMPKSPSREHKHRANASKGALEGERDRDLGMVASVVQGC